MYQHHKDSLEKAIDYFKNISDKKESIIAIIFGGSVAKGCERSDSDLDFEIILTDECHAALEQAHTTAETIDGYCTYEGGYFDVKYYTKGFLTDVAQKGSEPARNAFLKAKVLYTKDPEIPGLIDQITKFQTELIPDKMISFYGAFCLNTGYFWDMSYHDPFLRTKTVGEIVLYGLRMLLEEREVFFPCPKSLMKTVERLENCPEGVLEAAEAFLKDPNDETKEIFVNLLMGALQFQPPKDFSVPYTRYIEDNELWWRNPRPLVPEW